MGKENFKFSTNWNGKLFCDYFTTMRDSDYEIGQQYPIFLQTGKIWLYLGDVEIVKKIALPLDKLTEPMCFIDTAYPKSKTIGIIKTMYKKRSPNIATINWYLLHFVRRVAYPELPKIKKEEIKSTT